MLTSPLEPLKTEVIDKVQSAYAAMVCVYQRIVSQEQLRRNRAERKRKWKKGRNKVPEGINEFNIVPILKSEPQTPTVVQLCDARDERAQSLLLVEIELLVDRLNGWLYSTTNWDSFRRVGVDKFKIDIQHELNLFRATGELVGESFRSKAFTDKLQYPILRGTSREFDVCAEFEPVQISLHEFRTTLSHFNRILEIEDPKAFHFDKAESMLSGLEGLIQELERIANSLHMAQDSLKWLVMAKYDFELPRYPDDGKRLQDGIANLIYNGRMKTSALEQQAKLLRCEAILIRSELYSMYRRFADVEDELISRARRQQEKRNAKELNGRFGRWWPFGKSKQKSESAGSS